MDTANKITFLKLLLVAACLAFAAMAWMDDPPTRAGIADEGIQMGGPIQPTEARQVTALPVAEEALPTKADEGMSASNRVEEAPAIEAGQGCVRGRVLEDGKPKESVTVLLVRAEGRLYAKSSGGKTSSGDMKTGNVGTFKSTRQSPGVGDLDLAEGSADDSDENDNSIPGSSAPTEEFQTHKAVTDDLGEFSFCLKPDKYLFMIYSWGGGTPPIEFVMVEGELHDLGDVHIVPGSPSHEASIHLQLTKQTGSLLIHADRAGLHVRTTVEGQRESTYQGTTRHSGDANFPLTETDPIRIDLVDHNGFILGSTDRYEAYPRGVEVELFIPSVPGTLKVHLPPGVQAKKGVNYQVQITRTDSPELDLRIQSIAEKRIPMAEKGYRTSPQSLEFKALRTGAYDVKAIRREWVEETQTFDVAGEWLRGQAFVFAGQVSHCALE